MAEVRAGVRAARRSDLQAMADLRLRYLGQAAHSDPRIRLLADARQRTEQALPVWMGQEDRVLLVAEQIPDDIPDDIADGGAEPTDDAGEQPAGILVGYAMGVLHTRPPVLQSQRVGEIAECYVLPEARGAKLGRALVGLLTEVLRGRGAQVLRAAMSIKNEDALARLKAGGYEPLQVIMDRRLDAL